MSVKISELPILDSLADNDVIAGVDTSANVTSKIEMATLKNYIDTNTQYTAGTNINITDNVISAPFVYDKTQTNALLDDFKDETNASIEDLKDEKDAQIEELQSEIDSLSTIFNAFPTESGEGESLTLDDTAEVKFKKFDLKGNTSQTTYSGKNKLDLTGITTKTLQAGITVTPNFEGNLLKNIKISGTPTATSWLSYKSFTLDAGSYTLSGINVSDTAKTGLKIGLYIDNSRQWFISSNSPTYTFTLNETTTCQFVIWVQSVDYFPTTDTYITPMIRLSSVTDDTYEPFVGGTASPNPSFPQTINVVSGDNEINVVGKNLLENTFQSQTANGITFTRNENGSLSFIGTTTQAHSITGRFTKELILKSGVTYTFSLGNKQAGYGVYLQQTGNVNVYYLGVSATNSSLAITPTEDTTITQLAIHFPNGNTVNGTIYPMLEVGSSATSYEPYIGNTYNIDLPVENLWGDFSNSFTRTDLGVQFTANQDGTITANGTATNVATSILLSEATSNGIYKTLQKGTYTVSGGGAKYSVEVYDKNNVVKLGGIPVNGSKVSFTINEETQIVLRIQVASGVTINETIKLQLEKGSKANSYIPYGTTPIELCKIESQDHTIKYQDYFYKDSDKWYLHKAIGKYVFNGTSVTSISTYWLQSKGVYGAETPKSTLGLPNNYLDVPSLCTSAHHEHRNWVINNNDYNFTVNDHALFFFNGGWDTKEKANTALNGAILYYALPTPTDIEVEYQPLIDQLNELEKAISYEGQTNISQISNDKPFILDATAIKSLQNVLDRIELLES